MRLSATRRRQTSPCNRRDLVAGAVRVIDQDRVLAALGHTPVVDLVANGAGLVELRIQVIFQALVVEVIARIHVATVFVVVRVRHLQQARRGPLLDGMTVLLAVLDYPTVELGVLDIRIQDVLVSAAEARQQGQNEERKERAK